MTVSATQQAAATRLVYEEARCLDEWRWADWLELYHDDALFWTPGWRENGEPTSDPETELSLIYCSSRAQLKERADRVSGGRSLASMPLLRTAHVVANVMVAAGETAGALRVRAVGTTHVFNVKRREQTLFFSQLEYLLSPGADGTLRIARKKIVLLNDYIPRMIDFYTI